MTAGIGRLWVMSLQAGILIPVILLARVLLKKYPKIYTYCLWILVGIRLLCPIFIETPFSLQPDYAKLSGTTQAQTLPDGTANTLPGAWNGTVGKAPLLSEPTKIDMPDISQPESGGVPKDSDTANAVSSSGKAPDTASAAPDITPALLTRVLKAAAVIYVIGATVVSVFYLYQYFSIKRRISTAVRDEDNVWICENISSPFVIGIFNPRIILPYALPDSERLHILKHEQTHIRHHDPFIRLVGLVCLCLHWWNPLVWLAVHKMNQDMEMFCDETALKASTAEERKAYARTLLSFAERHSGFSAGLAFGESNTERRVKNIMNKRKGSIFTASVIAILIVFLCGCFMTTPKDDQSTESSVTPTTPNTSAEQDTSDSTSAEQPQTEQPDINTQLKLIAENTALWLPAPDNYVGDMSYYAVTDLDQNGRLEIIASHMGGTGGYTNSRFFEVNEQFDGLAECLTDFTEYSSQPDIITENTDMYYDAAGNTFYYIEEDMLRLSFGEYLNFTSAMSLKNGKLTVTVLKSTAEYYPDYRIIYQDGTGNEITKTEYDKITADAFFAGRDKYEAVFGWQDMRELESVTDTDALVNLLGQSYGRFGFHSGYEQNNLTDKAAYNAYASVLKNLCDKHEFPGGEAIDGLLPSDDMSNNLFAIADIDSDGRDELIISYTTTYMAGMIAKIYDYDNTSGNVREQFSEWPDITFYGNGTLWVGASHNHGRAPELENFWPYTLYRYNRLEDNYFKIASVDAWDINFYNSDGSFPTEADIDGDGILYFIMIDGETEYNTPLDTAEYTNWLNACLDGSEQLNVSWKNMTSENIENISSMQ